MDLTGRFWEEYRGCFSAGSGQGCHMDDLGYSRVVFTLFRDGERGDVVAEGPGYDAANKGGYRRLKRVLKDLEQNNIRVVEEKTSW